MLRFIYYQDDIVALGRLRQEEFVKAVNKGKPGFVLYFYPEILDYGFKELYLGEQGIKDKGGLYVLHVAAQEIPAQRGLACAYFAGYDHDAFSLSDPVYYMGQGLLMLVAREEKRRVGGYVERTFF